MHTSSYLHLLCRSLQRNGSVSLYIEAILPLYSSINVDITTSLTKSRTRRQLMWCLQRIQEIFTHLSPSCQLLMLGQRIFPGLTQMSLITERKPFLLQLKLVVLESCVYKIEPNLGKRHSWFLPLCNSIYC